MSRLVPGQIIALGAADQDITRFAKVITARSVSLDGSALADVAQGDVTCGALVGAAPADTSYCAFFAVNLTEAAP